VPIAVAFLDELRRRGFIEGQNLTVEYRAFGTHFDLLSQYAAELVNARVDVIVAAGDDAVHAVQQATKPIPIVATGGDLLGSGFVNSLSLPNGNTTGVSILATKLDGKRQELLIEAIPGLRRMAALSDANRAAVKLEALQEAARARNIELSIYRIAKGEEIAAAIDMAKASGATALNVLASPLLYTNGKLIMERSRGIKGLEVPGFLRRPLPRHEAA
jgi:putative ABC transport system substrate-binding protein